MSDDQNQIKNDNRFTQMKKLFELYGDAEVNLVTTPINGSSHLVFATIRLLPKDSFQSYTSNVVIQDCDKQKFFFRKVIMKAQDAINWYRTNNGEYICTPLATSTSVLGASDYKNHIIQVANFTDENIWGEFALPLTEQNILERWGDNPCPFLGYDSARIHRRFSESAYLQFLLQNTKAIKFIEQSLYIDLSKYPEYLGGMTLILPNPIIKSIEEHLIPANETNTQELCLFKFNAYPSQSLDKLKLISLTENLGFLKNVKSYSIPEDGILTIPQTIPFQSQGYFLVHDDFGCLEFRAPTSYLRAMNLSINIHSKKIQVNSKESNRKSAPEYQYTQDIFSSASSQVVGAVTPDQIYERTMNAKNNRLRMAKKRASGQVWFKKENRLEALEQIGELISKAQHKVSFYDPYFGDLQLTQYMKFSRKDLEIKILTSKSAFETGNDKSMQYRQTYFSTVLKYLKTVIQTLTSKNVVKKNSNISSQLQRNIKIFGMQLGHLEKEFPNISCVVLNQSTPDLHDRFLQVDDDIWFIGHSFNEIGKSNSLMLKVPDAKEVSAHLSIIEDGEQCLPFETFVGRCNEIS